LEKINSTIKGFKKKNDEFERVQKLMGDPPSPNKEFEDLKKKFDGRYDLWNNYVNFKEQK